MAHLRTSAGEGAADVDCWFAGVAEVLVTRSKELNPRFVEQRRTQHCRLRHLNVVKAERRVVRTLGQRESTHAVILRALVIVRISGHERISLVQLIIEARAEIERSARHQHPKGLVYWIQPGIQDSSF